MLTLMKTAEKKLLVLLCLLMIFGENSAQNEIYDYGIYFNQYFNDPQVNLRHLQPEDNLNFHLVHRRNSNDFGGINTSIFNVQYRFGKNPKKGSSELGLQIFSDREGELIRRNRVLPYFAKHLKINANYSVAGGVGVGFYNFHINSDGVFEGASAFALDASAFVQLHSKRTSVQLTVNQATNAQVIPVDQAIVLGRSFNFFASHLFKLNRTFEIKPSVLGRYAKKNSDILTDYTFGVGTHLIVEKKVSLGSSFEYNSGYNFSVSILRIPIPKDFLDVEISYFVPSSISERTNVQMFEIALICTLKKNN